MKTLVAAAKARRSKACIGLFSLLIASLTACAQRPPLNLDDLLQREQEEVAILEASLRPQLDSWLAEARPLGEAGRERIVMEEVKIADYDYTLFVTADGKDYTYVESPIYSARACTEWMSYKLTEPITFRRTGMISHPFEATVRISVTTHRRTGNGETKIPPVAPTGFRLPAEGETLIVPGPDEQVIIPIAHGSGYFARATTLLLPVPRSHHDPKVEDAARPAVEQARKQCLAAEEKATHQTVDRSLWYSVTDKQWVRERSK
ncbi:MAG: hypothetical protein WD768_12745 [Phycisphaeraceae bacterium]